MRKDASEFEDGGDWNIWGLTFELLQTTKRRVFPLLQFWEGGVGGHSVLFWSNIVLEARKSGPELLHRRLRRVGFLQQLTDGVHGGPESELLQSGRGVLPQTKNLVEQRGELLLLWGAQLKDPGRLSCNWNPERPISLPAKGRGPLSRIRRSLLDCQFRGDLHIKMCHLCYHFTSWQK